MLLYNIQHVTHLRNTWALLFHSEFLQRWTTMYHNCLENHDKDRDMCILLSLHSPKWSLILVVSTKMPRIFQKMVSLLPFLLHLKLSMNICNLFKNWELKPEFQLWMINEAFVTCNFAVWNDSDMILFYPVFIFPADRDCLISKYLLL